MSLQSVDIILWTPVQCNATTLQQHPFDSFDNKAQSLSDQITAVEERRKTAHHKYQVI